MRVLRSDDDMLFLVGGSNDVLRLYSDAGFAELVPVEQWRARMAARAALFARLGIAWRHLLVPEKLSVLGDAVLARQVADPRPPGARFADALAHPAVVYPLDYLRAQQRAGHVLYPRTDSHWTSLGALCAFQWLATQLGLEIDYAPFLATTPVPMTYRGDLWGDGYAGMPDDAFERRAVPDCMRRARANPLVRLKERRGLENEAGLHVGSHVVYRNDAAQRRERVMLFGSSFSECRAECSLLTYVAALFFAEVHFVWSTSLDPVLIERTAPDLAIVEMPERFLTSCPTDCFDLAGHEARVMARWDPPDAASQPVLRDRVASVTWTSFLPAR